MAFVLAAAVSVLGADANDSQIDWQKARQLHQKSASGATLTPDEQTYLDRAMQSRNPRQPLAAIIAQLPPAEQEQARAMIRKRQTGEPLTDDERALQRKIQELMSAKGGAGRERRPDAAVPASRDHTGLIPLTEMSGEQRYQGYDGGLYGGGRNEPPAEHAQAALAEAGRIVPLDPSGKPSAGADARIVLLSVGMSNTTQEFSRFVERANADPAKSERVILVDGAQGGQAAAQWAATPDSRIWQTVDSRLKSAGVTAAQVQAVWLKQAEIRPTEAFPGDVRKLTADEATILRMLKTRFPNLRIAYLSSRIYAGYATTALNPEPYAYQGAFAVRDLIQQQIKGEPALNWDAKRGPVVAPLLLWGPYLWADGMTPRRSDGLVWKREDLREDGTHPSVGSGRDKVAGLLLDFLKSDPTARPWFLKR